MKIASLLLALALAACAVSPAYQNRPGQVCSGMNCMPYMQRCEWANCAGAVKTKAVFQGGPHGWSSIYAPYDRAPHVEPDGRVAV